MSEPLARDIMARIHRAPLLFAEDRADALVASLRQLAAANATQENEAWRQRKHDLVAAYGLPDADQRKPFAFSQGKAIVPVHGTLINRFSASWGFVTGYNFIRNQVAAAAADPDVETIMLDINSFGGMCAGCAETADLIYAARETKQIVGVVDAFAYSAGYMLASAASRLIATPTGGVGSIGVVAMHANLGPALDKMGIEVTFIHAGKKKVNGNPYEALSDEARADIQREVDAHYDVFVAQVARNRSMDEKAVRDTEAGTYTPNEALSLGLVDAVSSPAAAMAGTTAGRDKDRMSSKEGAMPGEQQNQAASDAAAEAKATERARVKGILGHANAKGREALAQHLAMETDMTVEAAAAVLAAAPLSSAPATAPEQTGPGAFKKAMDADSHPNLSADGGNGGDKQDDKAGGILANFQRATGWQPPKGAGKPN